MGECSISEERLKGRRHPLVCLDQKCFRCPLYNRDIPPDCEYKIYHGMETRDYEIDHAKVRSRRSGKTTRTIEQANLAAAFGQKVVVVMLSHRSARVMRGNLHKGVRLISNDDVRGGKLLGSEPAYIFLDDISYDKWSEIENLLGSGSVVVSREYTP